MRLSAILQLHVVQLRRRFVNLFSWLNDFLNLDLLVRALRRCAPAISGAPLFVALFCLVPSGTPAASLAAGMQTLDKNDPAFFKKMYTDKKGKRMPYRVYVPANYDSSKKYPLIFFFHSGSGRGFNNEQQ